LPSERRHNPLHLVWELRINKAIEPTRPRILAPCSDQGSIINLPSRLEAAPSHFSSHLQLSKSIVTRQQKGIDQSKAPTPNSHRSLPYRTGPEVAIGVASAVKGGSVRPWAEEYLKEQLAMRHPMHPHQHLRLPCRSLSW
jgi:hypothetical protein